MTLIDDLRAKKEKLTDALYSTIDGIAYDKIDAELREVTKALTLAENQEKKRQADEAAAKRKAELDAYNAEAKRLQKAKKDADALDPVLFDQIQSLYDNFAKAYDARMRIIADTKLLQRRAEEIGLDIPPNVTLAICNFSDSQGDQRDFFTALIGQYAKAVGSLYGANKRKEKGAPTRPGMDWYTKGGGQFYPRDPIPEEDPKEGLARTLAERLKEATQQSAANPGG